MVSEMESMRVLVIAAHPDDEVIGCGATIARLAMEGKDVFTVILGEGITSRYPERKAADKKLVKSLREKAKKVAKILGVKDLFLFDFPDNRFDTVPLLDIVKKIEGVIAVIKPDIVFTHSSCDLNIDHQITHRAVLTVTRPQKGCSVKEIYNFEIPSSTEWAFGEFGSFKPNVFFDIGNTIELKIKTLEIYDSEVREFPHPRSPEGIKIIGRRWGSVINSEYTEVFQLIRSIR